MNHIPTLFERAAFLDLRLFDGEGAGAPAGDAGAGADAQPAGLPGEEAGSDNFTSTPETESAESRYRSFMNDPEMKKLHEKQFQQELGRRMKNQTAAQAAMQKELDELRPIGSLLRATKGAADNKTLLDLLKNDSDNIDEEAAKLGMTRDGYIKWRDSQIDLAVANSRIEAFENAREAALRQQYNEALDRELEELREIYPDADPDELRANDEFMQLMKLPAVSARHAYEVINADRLFSNVAREGIRIGKQKAAEALRARQSRPAENGTGSRSAGVLKPADISKMTNEQMNEFERMAARGICRTPSEFMGG